MRTESKRPYRWTVRNRAHAAGELSRDGTSGMPRTAGIWQFTGTNRATTRAFRSNTGPRPLYSRVAPFEQIGWFPEFRTYTHPRSART